MLIEFSVENFLSFREKVTLSMLATPARKNSKVFTYSHTRKLKYDNSVLPVMAIYGANAYGKSNLIKSIEILKNAIIDERGIGNTTDLRNKSKKFLFDKEFQEKPTVFDILFYITKTKSYYRYIVLVNTEKVVGELLLELVENENRKALYKVIYSLQIHGNNSVLDKYISKTFQTTKIDTSDDIITSQKANTTYKLNKKYKLTSNFKASEKENEKQIYEIFLSMFSSNYQPSNGLFISFLASLSNDIAKHIIEYFQNIEIFTSKTSFDNSILRGTKDDVVSKIKDLLKNINIAIDDIQLEKTTIDNIPNLSKNQVEEQIKNGFAGIYLSEYLVVNDNNVFNYYRLLFKLKEQILTTEQLSDGTRRVIELYSVFNSLDMYEDKIYIIDELEKSLHPELMDKLLSIFIENTGKVYKNYDPIASESGIHNRFYKNATAVGGQLIFTTHNVDLLDEHIIKDRVLRPDEITIVDKNNYTLVSSTARADRFFDVKTHKDIKKINLKEIYQLGHLGGTPRIK